MLKIKRVTEKQGTTGLKPRQQPGVPYARTMASHNNRGHGSSVGWYRGKQAGQIDVILTLQEMGHTRIAAKLQKHYGINDNGSLEM